MSTPSSSTSLTQTERFATISTPFGTDVLVLEGFAGREAISELFHFDLRMLSANRALDPKLIVGQPVSITLQRGTDSARVLHGIVTRFAHTGSDVEYGHYSAELSPSLWLLTLGRNRVIWQNKTALDIIKAVLDAAGVTYQDKTQRSFVAREYCVQYDESAFSFLSRLMEEEGIFYYFTFASNGHTLVLSDASSDFKAYPGETLFIDTAKVSTDSRVLGRFSRSSGVVAEEHYVSDYDYTKPTQSLLASKSDTVLGKTGQRFTYPGRYTDASQGAVIAKLHAEAHSIDRLTGHGESGAYALAAGTTFALEGHPDASCNVSYAVRAVNHRASGHKYSNEIEVFPATVPFRAPLVTPRPVVAGTHTAVVVGNASEEIWTDSQGRVKLKFPWDRSGTTNQDCSCWVRVAQSMAGGGFGHLFLPRIGQEVVVSYVDGDPDRPLVTGSVYNGANTPPVSLPDNQTQSVIRSRSSKNGTAGNEIRMEDKLDAEELYLHAQKDMKVDIENALTTTVKAGAETHTVSKGDRTIAVSEGSESHTVKGKRTLDITGEETHTNHAKFTHDVGGDHVHTINGNYTLKVGGNLTIEVTGSISIKAGTSFASEAGTTHASKAATTLSTEGAMISHKASATQTVEGSAQLALKGGIVQLN